MAEYFQAFGGAVQTTAFEPRRFLADGELVVVLGHYTLRLVKTGTVVDNEWAHAVTLRGEKIATFEGFEDSAKVVAAFTG